MAAFTPTTPLVAGEHDHATQDQQCTWCRTDIGLCAFIRGANGSDIFHAEPCFTEVSVALPIDEAVTA